jgi:hypothetical protein
MAHDQIDWPGLVFFLIGVAIAYWAWFVPERQLLAWDFFRRTSLPRWRVLSLKIPAAVVAVIGTLAIVRMLLRALLHHGG